MRTALCHHYDVIWSYDAIGHNNNNNTFVEHHSAVPSEAAGVTGKLAISNIEHVSF